MIISVLRSTKDSKFLGFYIFFKYRRNLKWFEVEYVIGIFYFYLISSINIQFLLELKTCMKKQMQSIKFETVKRSWNIDREKRFHIKINIKYIYKVYIDQTATGCTLIILSSLLNFLK